MCNVLFTIKPHSIVDVITNSSSELFVGKSQSKEEIESLIKEVYPDYLNEYENLKSTSELNRDDLRTYISYHYEYWSFSEQREIHLVIPGFKKEEMYEWHDDFEDWDFKRDFFNENNIDRIKSGIDPNNVMYFLFSISDNPNYDHQEELEKIMTRYHLG